MLAEGTTASPFTATLAELNLASSGASEAHNKLIHALRLLAEGRHGADRMSDSELHRLIHLHDVDGWSDADYRAASVLFRDLMEPKLPYDVERGGYQTESDGTKPTAEDREARKQIALEDLIDVCRGIDTKQARMIVERYESDDWCPEVRVKKIAWPGQPKVTGDNPEDYHIRHRRDDQTANRLVRAYVTEVLCADVRPSVEPLP